MAHPAPPGPVPGPSQPNQSMLKRMGGPSDLKAGVGKGGARTTDEIAQITYDASKVRLAACSACTVPIEPS